MSEVQKAEEISIDLFHSITDLMCKYTLEIGELRLEIGELRLEIGELRYENLELKEELTRLKRTLSLKQKCQPVP